MGKSGLCITAISLVSASLAASVSAHTMRPRSLVGQGQVAVLAPRLQARIDPPEAQCEKGTRERAESKGWTMAADRARAYDQLQPERRLVGSAWNGRLCPPCEHGQW